MMLWLLGTLVGCGPADSDSDVEDPTPICDGRRQEGEETIDAPFDQDGDGFFDQNNADCAAVWSVNQLDCDDSNPNVNPSKLEIPCNGVDDDCRDASEENADRDGDGVGLCTDCDDSDPSTAPGLEDVCFDRRDNDCDGVVDNDCGEDYQGTWTLDDPINFTCSNLGTPLITMDVPSVAIGWVPPNLSVDTTSGTEPPALDGTVGAHGEVSISYSGSGDCAASYTLTGTFLSDARFEGELRLQTSGFLFLCGNCPNSRVFPFDMSKQP